MIGNCCKKTIENVNLTLQYYCGYVIPDSNIITGGLISKDLRSNKFFENFNIIISPIVFKECDTPGGKREMERLAESHSKGQIKLDNHEKIESLNNSSNLIRDEKIVEESIKYNAIFVTGDNNMKAYAMARDVFTIFT